MRKIPLLAALATALCASFWSASADAESPRIAERWAQRHARSTSWHGDYYHTSYGRPVALVVPPTATTYTSLGWGVAQSEVRPLHHQFRRLYPGAEVGRDGHFLPTPPWPSHTDQFGVYYIRGPW